MIAGLDTPTTAAAVFDNRAAAEDFVKAVKAGGSRSERQYLDFRSMARSSAATRRNLCRHSVGYSLGFEGKTEHLPNDRRADAGHHVRAWHGEPSLAKKMIDWVKEGRRTPEQAVSYMTRFCSCGVFNPSRGKRILEEARTRTK